LFLGCVQLEDCFLVWSDITHIGGMVQTFHRTTSPGVSFSTTDTGEIQGKCELGKTGLHSIES